MGNDTYTEWEADKAQASLDRLARIKAKITAILRDDLSSHVHNAREVVASVQEAFDDGIFHEVSRAEHVLRSFATDEYARVADERRVGRN